MFDQTSDISVRTRMVLRAHVWLLATLIPLLDRLMTLPKMLRLLTPRRPWRGYRAVSASDVLAAVERRLARPRQMKRRACLRRGLVVFHLLRLTGRPARLHFGVYPQREEGDRLRGHCWVECEGQVLCTPPEPDAAEVMIHGQG